MSKIKPEIVWMAWERGPGFYPWLWDWHKSACVAAIKAEGFSGAIAVKVRIATVRPKRARRRR